MNIEDALSQADSQSDLRETLRVVGSIETDSGGNGVRVYPHPQDLSHYVVIDPQHIDGEVLDVTEHARLKDPTRRGPVFSVPVRKGGQIQIVAVTTIEITDVSKMQMLSLNQSGGCRCAGKDAGKDKDHGPQYRDQSCFNDKCYTIDGLGPYPCIEIHDDYSFCSTCCFIV
jgi:hypothetical protein